jgi:nicotinate-nucleotide--dimethylbenzimidazole phosphoribosyltransferase
MTTPVAPEFATLAAQIPPLAAPAMTAARARQDQLTKPPGSLGRLESLSVQLAGITGQLRPRFRQPALLVFAADHGIARQGVSAYPREVTAQMVANMLTGGAAINVLARHAGARLILVDVGVAAPLAAHPALLDRKIGLGTADFAGGPAMTRAEARRTVEAGIAVVDQAITAGADLLGLGEIGIGNTTAASAVVAAITGRPVAEVTGRGTGVTGEALHRKIRLIAAGLARNQPDPADGLDVLAKVGGYEIGALAGAMLGAARRRVPVVLDGFICGAAALIAVALAPAVQPYLIAAHRSAEAGHRAVLDYLRLRPLLDLDLRLGEGSGAALALALCQAAGPLLDEMMTFDEAGVSTANPRNFLR